jgi:GTP-binding protein EngB required for normal cell division
MGSQFQSEYGSNGYQEENDHFYDAPASYTETLGSVPLGTDESNKELLDQLDQLRECGVDEYIDLPQVVVAGDQSSGKSSTLEALTGIPFPRDSVKCTKFATEIRLRRSDEVKTTVAIIPDNSRSPEQRKRLAEFEQMVEDQTDFGTIFENATAAIFAISSHNNFLSKDKLRIEISGPDQPHLMVVDLPGIIHAATDEQTPEDKEAILSLVQHYMQQERTIILPVVSCNNDYSNQVVLEMMKKCDPDGVRTLGIITKPDVTFAPKREAEFINLASNKDRRNRLLLGWHVVRNRSPQEGHFTLAQWRAKEAEFFVNGNWGANLPKDHLGVDALLKRLSVELNRHISAQVPKVKVDIELELAECRKKLLELGEGRDTPEQMREAISGWCQRSARITLAAVQGHGMNPSGETFFLPYHDAKTYARKFRNNLWQKNREFAEKMEDRGEDCKILDAKGSQPRRTSQRRDDVEGELLEVTRSQYIQQVVKPMLNNNKGQELPMDHNPLLVYDLFQLHSQNWLEYADNHIKNINTLLEDFLWQVLFYLWPNQLQKRFWFGFIQAEMENRISEAKAELQKIEMDRKRSVTPYERRLIERYNEWKLASHDAERDADQDSEELPDQTCEELLQKMLLVYDVSICSSRFYL